MVWAPLTMVRSASGTFGVFLLLPLLWFLVSACNPRTKNAAIHGFEVFFCLNNPQFTHSIIAQGCWYFTFCSSVNLATFISNPSIIPIRKKHVFIFTHFNVLANSSSIIEQIYLKFLSFGIGSSAWRDLIPCYIEIGLDVLQIYNHLRRVKLWDAKKQSWIKISLLWNKTIPDFVFSCLSTTLRLLKLL